MGGIHLKMSFDSLEDFYNECITVEKSSSYEKDIAEIREERENFRGLPIKKILESKYSYTDGVKKYKEIESSLEIEADSLLGNKDVKRKWSDIDGDDMDYERLLGGFPFLSQRVFEEGKKNGGKYITIYVDIGEPWYVGYNEMLHKAFTVVKITDFLESIGKRIKIVIAMFQRYNGRFKGESIETSTFFIPVKDFNDPLSIGTLITVLSPWMFRYWFFSLLIHKIYTSPGLGSPRKPNMKSDFKDENIEDIIIITTGECLNKEGSLKKLKEIKERFE